MHDSPNSSATPLRSRYAQDPEMSELVEWFVSELPGRMTELESYFREGRTEEIRRMAHQLRGSGSAYGFDEITSVAQTLEQTIAAGTDVECTADSIRDKVDALVETCRRAVF